MSRALGRHQPSDWRHVERYPLSALAEAPTGLPVALGINWYSAFDNPQRVSDGSYWIGRDGNLGHIRGGHAIASSPDRVSDLGTWYRYYDQGSEGACVGFAVSRLQTLANRRVYNAFSVYYRAKQVDEWPGENYDGTSLRAGLEVIRTEGAPLRNSTDFRLDAGITEYRWLTSVDEIRAVLASPRYDERGGIRLLNSWGTSYPHYVWMTYEVLERVLSESGEAAVVTDR